MAAMRSLPFVDGQYQSPPAHLGWLARIFPSWSLYRRFVPIVWRASQLAKRGRYGDEEWQASSLAVLAALERVGLQVRVTGIAHLAAVEGPCVVIANHMSTLETVVLPGVIQPVKPVTFIVKQSLLETPVFRHVMRSRNPIAVTRANPRQDLKEVLEGGAERLSRGISIVVFPQTTRTVAFDPSQFSSIGAKLAARAGVPIVPLALQTQAWANGQRLKDFGTIDPSRRVRIAFGEALQPSKRGAEEHEAVVAYIQGHLAAWAAEDGESLPLPPAAETESAAQNDQGEGDEAPGDSETRQDHGSEE